VFADENGLLLDDPDHSHEEYRFILLGLSSSLRLIVVSHTYRKEGAVIRIISARKELVRNKNIIGEDGSYEKRI
jgi:uncharacterized protein